MNTKQYKYILISLLILTAMLFSSVITSPSSALAASTPPAINVTSPTSATIGIPYTLTPTVSGGSSPYTWSTTGKPSWLLLNQNSGVMSGTPGISAVNVTFTLQVKDKNGVKAIASVIININQPTPPSITVDSPTIATIGIPYTLTPIASGGAGAPYTWSTTGKPFWLELDQNTGVMTGTPGVSAVNATFTLQVKDKNGVKATASVIININQPTPPTITIDSPTTATIGTPYTLTPTASGGAGAPYTWSTTGKPFWLELDQNTGVMTGTPGVSAANVTFILQVKDKIGTKATTDVTINFDLSSPITISVPSSTITNQLAIPGNQTWTDTGINLNAGDVVSITATGTIMIAFEDKGTPPSGDGTIAGRPNFIAVGLPSQSLIGCIGSSSPFEVGTGTTFIATTIGRLYLGVNDEWFNDNSGQWIATITITGSPDATIGVPLILIPIASGGAGAPYTWSSNNLPLWLSLNASTGVLSGTPDTSANTVTFTLQVKDRNGTKATKDITIIMTP